MPSIQRAIANPVTLTVAFCGLIFLVQPTSARLGLCVVLAVVAVLPLGRISYSFRNGGGRLGVPAPPEVQAAADSIAARIGVSSCEVRVLDEHENVATLDYVSEELQTMYVDRSLVRGPYEDVAASGVLAIIAHEHAHKLRVRRSRNPMLVLVGCGALTAVPLPGILPLLLAWLTAGVVVMWLLARSRADEYAADAAVVHACPELAEQLATVLEHILPEDNTLDPFSTHPPALLRSAAVRRLAAGDAEAASPGR